MKYQSNVRYTVYIALLLALTFLLSRARLASVPVFSGSTAYRGSGGAALVCAVRFDANVRELANMARELDVPVTFFVSAAWARDNAELKKTLSQPPFECFLLGLAQNSAALAAELEEALRLGVSARYYMPSLDENAQKLSRELKKRGCRPVLSTFDIKQHTTEPNGIVDRITESCGDGAIIRFQPAKTMLTAFKPAVEALRENGARLKTLSAILGDAGAP